MAISKPMDITILGGGIAGLTTALSLTKFAPPSRPPPNITLYEIRPEPATIGGAVNLTPNALRLLSHLGALDEIRARDYGKECLAVEIFDLYTNQKIAESSFRGPDGKGLGEPPFTALRITRGDALKGVLAAIEKHANIKLICGKKTVDISEDIDGVTIQFEDGETVRSDILIGCDGIHSVTRLKHVEPERKSIYSGICNAFGFAKRRTTETGQFEETHFETSGMNFGRRGILLTSFHDSAKDSIYVGALMQVPEIASRDGWKAAGADAEKTRKDIMERYDGAANPLIGHLIEDAGDLFLWPVFTLSKGGKWATDRVMLIGDSAHAMPPQGESTGIVFEDGVLFSRCLAKWMQTRRDNGVPVKEAFDAYQKLRRARIDTAFNESQSVVKTVQDTPWLGHKIKMNVVPWYLWWTRSYRDKHFVEDVTTCELGY
ncbi:FAD/NAD(P)-binding domain-containing protein [Cucurbitaria berberidis CBS 394.84]|uniref:FAD/NAD(P)-binding domain-containing protein n=1 Tax=Cucurbitaria berberidis CBS 394.84 TaxID=1168544 RepID=A0A9P4GI75_9PLEO|nr:FAD/NAD(P)-binding domain-containing protein [Cucurbitaria berberidis CBS 394.84]KAF1845694.1 FAD/NAD(P)-binding domain-containing protein [Cucurbitaria berberidis CBS 394.84]